MIAAFKRQPLALLPALPVVGLWIYWGQNQGGYFPAEWYPSAVFVVALGAITAFATGRVLPAQREVRVPLLLFAALVGWVFVSALWSVSPGAAWDAANKLLLYLACAWVLALLPWTARRAQLLLGAWAIGLGAIAAVSLLRANGADDLSPFLFDLRYQDPVGYPNGNAALAVSGVWPALALASRRGASPVASGFFLALAALLFDFALLSQSRGSLLGILVGALAIVAFAPSRLRLLVWLLPVVLAVAFAIGPILDVYDSGDTAGSLGAAVDRAIGSIAVSMLVAATLGVVVGMGDRFVGERSGLRAAGRRAAVVGGAVLALGAIAAVLANLDRITERIDEATSSLSSDDSSGRTRASSLDPYERPDYWRVAIDLFAEAPLSGSGAGSFEHEYTARRHEPKHSRYTHNIYLRILGEEGVIGALLLLGFLGATIAFSVVVRRRCGPEAAGVLAASVAVMAYVLTHAAFDWLDELPAVIAPALALPLVALVAGTARDDAQDATRGLGRAATVAAAIVVVAALASLVPPWLSVRYLERAEQVAAENPQAAYVDLERAHSLNPHSLAPLLSEGRIAIESGQPDRASQALREAISIEDNWYSHFQLALLAAERRRFALAGRQMDRARELSANDPLLAEFDRMIAARRKIDPETANRELADRSTARFATSPR